MLAVSLPNSLPAQTDSRMAAPCGPRADSGPMTEVASGWQAGPRRAGVPDSAARPLKVFVLAGQSNMQGHASIATFDSLADDPKTAPLLAELRGDDGKPRVCTRVWISSVGCLGDAYSDLTEKTGKLTAGFGAPEDKIGPEFSFGIAMEKALDEPILIVKTAWGGRSLHTDFRPPSAGPYVWSDYELARHKERGDDLEKIKAEKAKDTGVYYREMIAHVRKVLQDIARVVLDTTRSRVSSSPGSSGSRASTIWCPTGPTTSGCSPAATTRAAICSRTSSATCARTCPPRSCRSSSASWASTERGATSTHR